MGIYSQVYTQVYKHVYAPIYAGTERYNYTHAHKCIITEVYKHTAMITDTHV